MWNIKNKALLAMTILTSFINLHAKENPFEGLSTSLSISTISSVTRMKEFEFGVYTGGYTDGYGRNALIANIGADYGLKLTERSVVLIGGGYSLNRVTLFNDGVTFDDEDFSDSAKMKSLYSVHIAPGTLIGGNVLLYTKLAYTSAKIQIDDDTKKYVGGGIGIGARFLLTDQVSFNFEFMRNQYGKKKHLDSEYPEIASEYSPSSTIGTIALNYNF